MGQILCYTNNSATASGRSDEIPVAAKYVGEILIDIETAPNFIPHLHSIEVLRGGPLLKEGTQWREVREFRRKNMILYNTVTKIEKHPYTTIQISMDLKEINYMVRNTTETASITVRPIDEQSCQIIWSIALITVGCLSSLKLALTRRCLLNYLSGYLDQEMSYYAKEAMRRAIKHQQHEIQIMQKGK